MNDFYRKYGSVFGCSDNFSVTDSALDQDFLSEFIDFVKNNQEKPDLTVLQMCNSLHDPNTDTDTVKRILVALSSSDNIEVLRSLQQYAGNISPDSELKNWVDFVINQCKNNVENSLLGTNKILISTGLGALNGKPRYFVAFISKDNTEFSSSQKSIINKELDFAASQCDVQIEDLFFDSDYAVSTVLIPFNLDIKPFFSKVVEEINKLGNFLCKDFIVTNVKKLSRQEITRIIEKNTKS